MTACQQETIELLKKCHNDGTELGHINADEIIVDFLKSIGYEKIAEEYDSIPKWYS